MSSGFGTPNKVAIPQRSQDFGSSKKSFATREDQELAEKYSNEDCESN